MSPFFFLLLVVSSLLMGCGQNQNQNESKPKRLETTAAVSSLHPSWNNEALQVRCYVQTDKVRKYIQPVGMLSTDGTYFNSYTKEVIKLTNDDEIYIEVALQNFDETKGSVIKPKNFTIDLDLFIFPNPSNLNEFIRFNSDSSHMFEKGLIKTIKWPNQKYEFGCSVVASE